jgi:hypothetical protein
MARERLRHPGYYSLRYLPFGDNSSEGAAYGHFVNTYCPTEVKGCNASSSSSFRGPMHRSGPIGANGMSDAGSELAIALEALEGRLRTFGAPVVDALLPGLAEESVRDALAAEGLS